MNQVQGSGTTTAVEIGRKFLDKEIRCNTKVVPNFGKLDIL